MTVVGGGAVSYERGIPVPTRTQCSEFSAGEVASTFCFLAMIEVPREQKMLKGHLPSHISPSIPVYEDENYNTVS